MEKYLRSHTKNVTGSYKNVVYKDLEFAFRIHKMVQTMLLVATEGSWSYSTQQTREQHGDESLSSGGLLIPGTSLWLSDAKHQQVAHLKR